MRATAAEALEHPWVKDPSTGGQAQPGRLGGTIVQRLQQFAVSSRLKQLVLAMITDDLLKNSSGFSDSSDCSGDLGSQDAIIADLRELYDLIQDGSNQEITQEDVFVRSLLTTSPPPPPTLSHNTHTHTNTVTHTHTHMVAHTKSLTFLSFPSLPCPRPLSLCLLLPPPPPPLPSLSCPAHVFVFHSFVPVLFSLLLPLFSPLLPVSLSTTLPLLPSSLLPSPAPPPCSARLPPGPLLPPKADAGNSRRKGTEALPLSRPQEELTDEGYFISAAEARQLVSRMVSHSTSKPITPRGCLVSLGCRSVCVAAVRRCLAALWKRRKKTVRTK